VRRCQWILTSTKKLSAEYPTVSSEKLKRADWIVALAVVSAAALIVIPGLGVRSLATWDEAIYGVVTRELISSPGLTLRYGGNPWFEKPPLLFWLMAGASSIFGTNEFSLRLPAAILSILTVLCAYLIANRTAGRASGIMAALLLLGLPQFIAYSRLATLDIPVVAFGTLTMLLIVYDPANPILIAMSGVVFGLAVLTKSAAAFLFLPGLTAILIALRGSRALLSSEMFLAAALSLAIVLPWHLGSLLVHGRAFVDQYVFYHMVSRFMRPIEHHVGDPFYYFRVYRHNAGYLADIHAAGVILAMGMAIRDRDRFLAALVLLATSAFLIVSAQATKIAWYTTPVYPAAAIVTAIVVTRSIRTDIGRFVVVALLIGLAIPGIRYGRGSFVEDYNILDYSPEVRSLRDAEPFANRRVSTLYLLDVSDPAPRFYLTSDTRTVTRAEVDRMLAQNQPFFCLTYKKTAEDLLGARDPSRIRVAAFTESLAVIERR
jgi:4-amino-4-deoxy-L-arabinose transferase-like glycosyltransferase